LHVGHYEGSLHKGFILKDVRITGLSYYPDALLRIQEIRVSLPLWDLLHSDFSIFNARIYIPDSDPVVFTGEVYQGQIKGNLYASSVDLHMASRFLVSEDIRKNLQGFISNIDLTIQGPWSSPEVNGHFQADNIRYKSITFTDGYSRLGLTLIPAIGQVYVKGVMILDSGLVNVRNTKLELEKSKFIFHEDVFNPIIDIHLGAKVEDMNFHLTVKGTSINPQLTVSSDPPMAPREALQVLFTGNALFSSTSPFNGVTSGELAQNFLNYSVQDINDDQRLGLKTKLTDNLKLGAEMDQRPAPPGVTTVNYSRKVNGEMDFTKHMSLNISQEVLPQGRDPSQTSQNGQTAAETQFYLQYKKRF
jgi:TamB, inner membrane protein subunit of TAM complex